MLLQVQSGQEVKLKITAQNWQQQVCHLFPTCPQQPGAASVAQLSVHPPAVQTPPDCAEFACDSHKASDTHTAAEALGAQSVNGAAGASDAQDLRQAAPAYWLQAPAVRLRMLRDLCHAALDSYVMR